MEQRSTTLTSATSRRSEKLPAPRDTVVVPLRTEPGRIHPHHGNRGKHTSSIYGERKVLWVTVFFLFGILVVGIWVQLSREVAFLSLLDTLQGNSGGEKKRERYRLLPKEEEYHPILGSSQTLLHGKTVYAHVLRDERTYEALGSKRVYAHIVQKPGQEMDEMFASILKPTSDGPVHLSNKSNNDKNNRDDNNSKDSKNDKNNRNDNSGKDSKNDKNNRDDSNSKDRKDSKNDKNNRDDSSKDSNNNTNSSTNNSTNTTNTNGTDPII